MEPETGAAAIAALLISSLLTALALRVALARGFLDKPNQRSSHKIPTPRGGGVAIVLAVTVVAAALFIFGRLDGDTLVAVVGGGLAVGFVGYLDDRYHLSARARIAVHFAAAAWAIAWLGGIPPLPIAGHVVALGWAGPVLGVVGIVWALNLFNFMDGIDGIAAAEATFVTCAGAVIGLAGEAGNDVSTLGFVVAAASLGFLFWNWPPAKIFMGDVGSGYLGYVIGVLAIVAAHDDPAGLFVWLILGGGFLVDSTLTLMRRVARREPVYEAHRTHTYQWLSRRWGSHRRVTLCVTGINLLWLLPLAWYASLHPERSAWVAVLALVPLSALALYAGAGRREDTIEV